MEGHGEFAALVQDVLEHLHDYPYLQGHRLADSLQLGEQLSPRERMRLLRTTVLEAIAELDPGPGVSFHGAEARTYNVLNLRYVAGFTVEAVAHELAISQRQAYRDLRKARERLAALLRSRHAAEAQVPAGQPSAEEMVLREAERLGSGDTEVPVQALVEGALAAVERLAKQLGVQVQATFPEGQVIYTDRALARQALVNVLSCALQSASTAAVITLSVQPVGTRVRVRVAYPRSPRGQSVKVSVAAAEQLIRHLGGRWSSDSAGGLTTVTFTLGERSQTVVLVVDDHEGLHELFRRFLADGEYRLLVASNGRDGVRLAREMMPDIIILDVMMPQEDGWEVLQSLQTHEATRSIPVIVCSVLRDTQLALSLGAVECLPKPVSRAQLLLALSRWRYGADPAPPIVPPDSGSPPRR